MDHGNHVALLEDGIHAPVGVWADFGAGRGAFTLALADLLTDQATIHAIDRDRRALNSLAPRLAECFPSITLHLHPADYTRSLNLPFLDGIVMANALHFQEDKLSVLNLLVDYLKPGVHFILVEYDTDQGNRWVPAPVSYRSWQSLAEQAGLVNTRSLATRPSSFLTRFYAALNQRADNTP
jgi:ubiquinone/menaquinone biosynthesis C-methylase UbiE